MGLFIPFRMHPMSPRKVRFSIVQTIGDPAVRVTVEYRFVFGVLQLPVGAAHAVNAAYSLAL